MPHGHIHRGAMYSLARCKSEKKTYTGTGVGQTITFDIYPEFIMVFEQADGRFYWYYDKEVDQSLRSGRDVSNPQYTAGMVKNGEFSIDVGALLSRIDIIYEIIAFQVSPHDFGEAMYYTPGKHKHLTGMETFYKGRLWMDSYVGDFNPYQDKNMVFEPGYLIIIDQDDELVYHTINPYCGVSNTPLYTLLEGYNITIPDRILNVVQTTVGSGIVNLVGDLNQNGHIYSYINFGGLSSHDCISQKGGGGPGHLHKGGWDTYNRTLMATFTYIGTGLGIEWIRLCRYIDEWVVIPDLTVIFCEGNEVLHSTNMFFHIHNLDYIGAYGPKGKNELYHGPNLGDGVDWDTGIYWQIVHDTLNKRYTPAMRINLAQGTNTLDEVYQVWMLKLI